MRPSYWHPTAAEPADLWVVEDHARFRDALVELIDATGRFRCGGAFTDCESALDALAASTLPDIVLMDLELPGASGIEGIRQIRMRAPVVPVLVLTVHQSSDRIFEAVCAGASGYLLKSAGRDEILDAIDRVVSGGAAMDAQIARRVLEMFASLTAPAADYGLSRREREILGLLVDGLTKTQIAGRIFLSPHTVDGHVRNIYAKLHVQNRPAAVAKAVRENLLGRKRPAG